MHSKGWREFSPPASKLPLDFLVHVIEPILCSLLIFIHPQINIKQKTDLCTKTC